MSKVYQKKIECQGSTRYFRVKMDYFGNWSIYSANEDFSPVVGAPPFSVGHRTKKQAIEFLESFDTTLQLKTDLGEV